MKNFVSLSLLTLTLTIASFGTALAQDAQEVTPPATTLTQDDTSKARPALKEYDLGKKDLALEGYDPVAYFKEFGGKATEGKKSITHTHRGVLYRFSSEANKKAFVANPTRFEPMYGGWCAWAMTDGKGDKTSANPKYFTIEDGRLYVFYKGFFGNTRKTWIKKGQAPALKANADKNWTRISGEALRKGDAESKK